MKKTWSILCAATLLALTLAGCAGKKTQGNLNPDPSPSPSAALQGQDVHGTADSGDLAGADGMVDGDGATDRTGNSPVERAGDGIRNAVDDAGDGIRKAADDVGDGVRDTLDDLGDAARDAGRDAKNMIEGR